MKSIGREYNVLKKKKRNNKQKNNIVRMECLRMERSRSRVEDDFSEAPADREKLTLPLYLTFNSMPTSR